MRVIFDPRGGFDGIPDLTLRRSPVMVGTMANASCAMPLFNPRPVGPQDTIRGVWREHERAPEVQTAGLVVYHR